MIALIFMEFIAFPQRQDAIFEKVSSISDIRVESSGSIGFRRNDGKCILTSPNNTLITDRKQDWCSNVGTSSNDKPWISYSLKNKKMKITGYSVRTGCCWYGCCCIDNEDDMYVKCCCEMFSFSFQVSNDNRTWKTLHKVENYNDIRYCSVLTYEINNNEYYTFARVVLDEKAPGCDNCMVLNQVEIYGSVSESVYMETSEDNDEESISIIGKVNRKKE